MRYYTVAQNGNWLEAEENTPGAQEYDEFEHLDNLIARIDAWDHEDIHELKNLIEQVTEVEKDCGTSKLDYSSLPSEEIPRGLEDYPIWAMDQDGDCLVGANADQIEHIEDIKGWYEEKHSSKN